MPRIEGAKEILERPIAFVVPVELLVGALQESIFGEECPFLLARECDVHRRGFGRVAQRNQSGGERSADHSTSTPSRTSSRGPVAGVKGTEA